MRPEDGLGVLEARILLFDVRAEVLEHFHRFAHERGDFGIDLGVAEIGRIRDAKAADAEVEARAVVAIVVRKAMPVARIGLRKHVQHQRGVGDGAGHRSDVRHGAEGRERPRGHAPEGRLDAEEPGEAARDADRAAAVGA